MIREFLQRRRHKKALSNIRQGMFALGIDLSHLSDEEIERRLLMASKRMSSAGVTAIQFAQGLQRFAVAVCKGGTVIGGAGK